MGAVAKVNTKNTLQITDRDGWKKDFPLEKSIVYIGSDPGNDVVLERGRGGGVAARHLQLVPLAAQGSGYRLVNLADADVLLGESGEHLAPYSFAQVAGGQRIRVGDFTLILKGVLEEPALSLSKGVPKGEEHTSVGIGLRLSLPQTQLAPHRPLEGAVIVRNLGDQTGVQFKLEVQGLDPDCYEMGPGPILFPNAEKTVVLRLHHPEKPTPPAGEHSLTIRATAPDAYPGESAVVSQIIGILPFYHHSLRLVTEVSQE